MKGSVMHTKIVLAVALVLGFLSVLVPSRAEATDCGYWSWDVPVPVSRSLCYPIPYGTTVVIQGPKYIWGLRSTAATIDRRLPGLHVVTTLGARCSSYPGAYCLMVRKADLATPGRAGEFDSPDQRYYTGMMNGLITLDPTWSFEALRYRMSIATHELLHALGMIHHTGSGLCTLSVDNTYASYLPNTSEWRTLLAWY